MKDRWHANFQFQILEALRTEKAVLGRSVAQCVATIALIEVVRGEWPEIIPQLTVNVGSPESSSVLKQSCLEAIGYICEEVVSSVV
jgi:importin subunit beta-1